MKNLVFMLMAIFGLANAAFARQPLPLKVDSLFKLAEINSKTLDISRYKIEIAANATAVERQRINLPDIGAGFSYAYLSNARVWDNRFNYDSTVKMPHTSLDLSVDASYLVFDGSASKNQLAKARLKEQVAQLDFRKDKEEIQFLLLAKYLDLAALRNQEQVFIENIALAEKRLSDIGKLVEQGMLTHNDEVRSELQLTEIRQQLTEIRNNSTIVNHDLNTVLGLPQETVIEPDTALYSKGLQAGPLMRYREGFTGRLPELELAGISSQLAEKQLHIQRSRGLPTVSLFAGDAVSRPFLYAMPPVDIYMHLLQTGIKVQYDIGSLYRNKRLVQQAKMEHTLAVKNEGLLAEKAEMAIHAAYIKLQDARQKFASQQESYRLARDNYRVVEQKYLNKFAVITDVVDASNALLAAQVNVNNARIGIIYQYYYLMKTSGFWDEVSH